MNTGDSSVYVDKAGLFNKKTHVWEVVFLAIGAALGIILVLQV